MKTIKKEYIDYAKRLSTIGDLIISIANLIKIPENAKLLSLEDIPAYKNELVQAIERNEYAKDSLATVKTPFIVVNQHKKLVERFGEYIESIEVLNNSIKISPSNEIDFNENEYSKGFELQEKCKKEIEKLCQLIGDRLLD